MNADNELRTPDEWCLIVGVKVLDPDGWRGARGRPWTDHIDRAEFDSRLGLLPATQGPAMSEEFCCPGCWQPIDEDELCLCDDTGTGPMCINGCCGFHHETSTP